jgi:hypothetical protein
MSQGVKITESFAQRIAATVRRVDAMPAGFGDGKIPTRFEDGPVWKTGGGSSISLGSYSTVGTSWLKGTFKTVTLYDVNESGTPVPRYSAGVPATTQVLNLFVTIPPNYDRTRFCAFASINGLNVLMTAEC